MCSCSKGSFLSVLLDCLDALAMNSWSGEDSCSTELHKTWKKNRSKDIEVIECFNLRLPARREMTPMLFSREYFSSVVSNLTLTFSLCVTVMLSWKRCLSLRVPLCLFTFLLFGSVEECILSLFCPCLGFTLKDLKLVGKCCVGTLSTLK